MIMRVLSLAYHDVNDSAHNGISGFEVPGARRYQVHPDRFARHLQAIADRHAAKPALVTDLSTLSGKRMPLLLTFDDGGQSAYRVIAPLLRRRGWPAHFFVATNFIGRPGFMTATHIRKLSDVGHLLGSHSASHPTRFSSLPEQAIFEEWQRSKEILQQITGKAITTASVPGGYFSARVARVAAAAGIKFLFTSEPTTLVQRQGGYLVLGRFAVLGSTSARFVKALLKSRSWARGERSLAWNLRMALKAAGGAYYDRLRDLILRAR